MTYEFRHFDLDRDIRPYIELCREVLAVEFSWEFLSWKNRDVRNPDRPPQIYLAIGEKGDIAGAISFFPIHLKFSWRRLFRGLGRGRHGCTPLSAQRIVQEVDCLR